MRQSEITLRLAVLAILSFSAAACTKEKREPPLATGGATGPATLSSMQAEIFTLSCAISGCHDNRATPAGALTMTSVQATYAGLVNRNSTQAPGRKLVAPAAPDDSYLVDKLTGVHLAVGGTGRRMPQDAAPLTPEEIDRVVTWINDGAQLN
jgi:hypothetical protein